MTFEEMELWEIVIPGHIAYSVWYEKIQHLISGYMMYQVVINGYWKSIEETSRVFRIACDELTIKSICMITSDQFDQECVMCYRVSNYCLLGHK